MITSLAELKNNDIYRILSQLIASDDDSDENIINSGVTRSDYHVLTFLIAWSLISVDGPEAKSDILNKIIKSLKSTFSQSDLKKLTVGEMDTLVSDTIVDWQAIISDAKRLNVELKISIHADHMEDQRIVFEILKDKSFASAAASAGLIQLQYSNNSLRTDIFFHTTVTQRRKWSKPFKEVYFPINPGKQEKFWKVPEFRVQCPPKLKDTQETLNAMLSTLNAMITQYNDRASALNRTLIQSVGVPALRQLLLNPDLIPLNEEFLETISCRNQASEKLRLCYNNLLIALAEKIQKDEKDGIKNLADLRIRILQMTQEFEVMRANKSCYDETGSVLFCPGEKK